jgi:uncharacterized protein (DUF488 family)
MTLPVLHTIGHSNHSIEQFTDLLQRYEIERLVDVRSAPYSRFSPQFNKHALDSHLNSINIEYVYLGSAIGGRPTAPECFDEAGLLDYQRISQQPWFCQGIDRLLYLAGEKPTVIMCSEEDPEFCHRNLLIGATLIRSGRAEIRHIRGNGTRERGKLEPVQTRLF